ncbi:MAG TPA: hypothetical protein VFP80_13960, partial [Thermoanaerobaculia bacterium]|nr:hypothetical protein [Thermoanaerobaculia bacterium]
PAAILLDGRLYPSQFFVQVLSVCVGAFGAVASVAILLNCAAYLLTCSLIERIARPRNNVVLAAIACSPASILFSLQPLKDTLFTLLIVAMIAAFRRWEESWRAGSAGARFAGYALAMFAVIFALAGIRWYVAVIAWGAAGIFFVLTALQAPRKGWAFASSALLLVLLAQSIRLGAHDLQPAYARLLNPMTVLQWRPAATQEHLVTVRKGFESTPGATTVAEGRALAPADEAPAAPPPGTPASTTIAEGGPMARPEPAPSVPASPPPSTPETTTAAESVALAQPDAAPSLPASPPPNTPETATVTESVAVTQPDAAPARPVSPPETTTTVTESVAVAQPDTALSVPASPPPGAPATMTVAEGVKPASPPPSAPPTTTVAEESAPAQPEIAPVGPISAKPRSRPLPGWASRIVTGFAAMFLPRFLGESLGLIRVGGGRGLWLFAEVDTLLFDFVLLYAIVSCARSLWRGRAKLTATFVFCLLVFAMTAGPMLYTVNNFGTLFRLRLMVFATAVVLPVTLRYVTLRDEGDAVQ